MGLMIVLYLFVDLRLSIIWPAHQHEFNCWININFDINIGCSSIFELKLLAQAISIIKKEFT